MAAIISENTVRPTFRRATAETPSARHQDEANAEASLIKALQGFGDTDYYLLRTYSLLERLEKAIVK